MEWKSDERHLRTFGAFSMVSEQNKAGETAHCVTLPDGQQLRVLPDDRTSGQRRSRTISEALKALVDVEGIDPMTYIVGAVAKAGLTWQAVLAEVTIEEWLDHWFEAYEPSRLAPSSEMLLDDLDTDGWEIVRKGESP